MASYRHLVRTWPRTSYDILQARGKNMAMDVIWRPTGMWQEHGHEHHGTSWRRAKTLRTAGIKWTRLATNTCGDVPRRVLGRVPGRDGLLLRVLGPGIWALQHGECPCRGELQHGEAGPRLATCHPHSHSSDPTLYSASTIITLLMDIFTQKSHRITHARMHTNTKKCTIDILYLTLS